MKHLLFLATFSLMAYTATAQIKVVTDGKVLVGSLMTPKDQFQIGDRWTFTNNKTGVKLINYNLYLDQTSSTVQTMRRFTGDGCSTIAFTSNGDLSFSTGFSGGNAGDAVTMYNRLNISTNGNVGIGTTAPREHFQIGDKWTFADYSGIKGINYNTYYDGSNKRFSSDGCSTIAFDSYGNISLSTAQNGGSANSSVSMITGMVIYSDSHIEVPSSYLIATNLYTYSDRKFKTNIVTLKSPLEAIQKLRGVSYDFSLGTDKASTEKGYGFVAQELQEVMPELVKADKQGQLTVNYIAVIPFLVEAVKSQQQQINALQDQLNQLGPSATSKPFVTTDAATVINGCQLLQNYPNPFSSSTKIQATVLNTVNSATLFVYDMTGAQKKSVSIKERGNVEIVIAAASLSPGVYLYTLICDGQEIGTKRMILTDQK